MNRKSPLAASRAAALFAAAILALQLAGCATVDPQKEKFRESFFPRWETNEVPYDEAPRQDQIARNVRDGFLGIFDNFFQGIFAASVTASTTGYIVQKLAIMFGDLLGLLDDNEVTEHVAKGILSQQFLKFGSGARTYLETMSAIHGTTLEGPKFTLLDYVGNDTFHVKVYGRPSGLTTTGGIILADFLIRPAGNFLLMFNLRRTAQTVDEFGLKVLQKSTEVPFL